MGLHPTYGIPETLIDNSCATPAAPVQEPVACVQDLDEVKRKHLVYEKGMDWKDPLYTTPPAAPETMTLQEVWNSAGGNPGIKPAKQDVLDMLKLLDEAVEQADKQEPVAHVVVVGDMVSVTTGSAGLKDLLTLGDGAPLYTTPPAAPVQEPSEALRLAMDWYDSGHEDREEFKAMMENLLVAPAAQRQWVGLTDEDIEKLAVENGQATFLNDDEETGIIWFDGDATPFARAIEAKLREKNGGQA